MKPCALQLHRPLDCPACDRRPEDGAVLDRAERRPGAIRVVPASVIVPPDPAERAGHASVAGPPSVPRRARVVLIEDCPDRFGQVERAAVDRERRLAVDGLDGGRPARVYDGGAGRECRPSLSAPGTGPGPSWMLVPGVGFGAAPPTQVIVQVAGARPTAGLTASARRAGGRASTAAGRHCAGGRVMCSGTPSAAAEGTAWPLSFGAACRRRRRARRRPSSRAFLSGFSNSSTPFLPSLLISSVSLYSLDRLPLLGKSAWGRGAGYGPGGRRGQVCSPLRSAVVDRVVADVRVEVRRAAAEERRVLGRPAAGHRVVVAPAEADEAGDGIARGRRRSRSAGRRPGALSAITRPKRRTGPSSRSRRRRRRPRAALPTWSVAT